MTYEIGKERIWRIPYGKNKVKCKHNTGKRHPDVLAVCFTFSPFPGSQKITLSLHFLSEDKEFEVTQVVHFLAKEAVPGDGVADSKQGLTCDTCGEEAFFAVIFFEGRGPRLRAGLEVLACLGSWGPCLPSARPPLSDYGIRPVATPSICHMRAPFNALYEKLSFW